MIAPWVVFMIASTTGMSDGGCARRLARGRRGRRRRPSRHTASPGDVADDADDADGAVARAVGEVERRRRRRTTAGRSAAMTCVDAQRSPLASLTAAMRGCSASAMSVSVAIGDAGAAGDVVEHHRQVAWRRRRRCSARRGPPAAACCSRARRRGGRGRRPSAAGAAELDGVARCRCVPTPAMTVARSPTASTTARTQLDLLGVGRGRRLAGGAVDDEAVVAVRRRGGARARRCASRSRLAVRRDIGVTIAVRTRPKGDAAVMAAG